jgi:hypothetical protein
MVGMKLNNFKVIGAVRVMDDYPNHDRENRGCNRSGRS